MKKVLDKYAWLIILLAAPVAGFITFRLQIRPEQASDLPQHTVVVDAIVRGLYPVPHPMFHYILYGISKFFQLIHFPISLNQAGVIFLTGWMFIIAYSIYIVLRYFLQNSLPKVLISILSIALLFVISIYPFSFSQNLYLGQWSPNIWHNPTMFMVKPFAFLSVFFFLRWVSNPETPLKGVPLLLGLFTFLSLPAKPSFVFFFFPAILLYLLLYIRKTPVSFYFRMMLVLLPSVILLALQYLYIYHANKVGGVGIKDEITFTLWGVTKLYSPNVLISLILAIAFPLFVVISDPKGFIKDKPLIFAWLCTFVAYAQASFLAEKIKFTQGNFTFGYSLSLSILFIFSVIHLINARNNNRRILQRELIFWTGLFIFGVHLASGIFYYYKYLIVGTYW